MNARPASHDGTGRPTVPAVVQPSYIREEFQAWLMSSCQRQKVPLTGAGGRICHGHHMPCIYTLSENIPPISRRVRWPARL